MTAIGELWPVHLFRANPRHAEYVIGQDLASFGRYRVCSVFGRQHQKVYLSTEDAGFRDAAQRIAFESGFAA